MLSITHHTKERPSTDAPVLNLLLDELIDNTHSHQFIRERKRKETNKDLKQVINIQTKAKTRSLERASLGPLRPVQWLNTTETKCSKLLTHQGEAKGLDTIGKRAKHKANSGATKSSQSMNASSP
jgi:triphosphoribosyl-dephospho-CoA synthetase